VGAVLVTVTMLLVMITTMTTFSEMWEVRSSMQQAV
jgi:hypothetical protein